MSSNLIITPNDGSGWACDASIDTEAWLEAVTNCEIEIEHDGWDSDNEVREAIEAREGCEYTAAYRDNVYNSENDFNSVFTFTVYATEGTDEWYCANDVYIAVCLHRGGDVRGNYGPVRLFRVDSPVDAGFLDWVLSWHIVDAPDELNDCLDVGYSNHPTSELYDHFKTESGEWRGGSFYHEDSKDECVPVLYVG